MPCQYFFSSGMVLLIGRFFTGSAVLPVFHPTKTLVSRTLPVKSGPSKKNLTVFILKKIMYSLLYNRLHDTTIRKLMFMKFSKLTVQRVKNNCSIFLRRIIIAAFLVITVNTTVNAQTVTVNTALDENNGVTTSIANLIATPGGAGISLREAIIAANNTAGANTILFNAALNGIPITLTIAGANENNAATGDLDITDALTITGNGPANTIVQAGTTNANGIDKVFSINPSFTLAFATNITGITIRFGKNPSAYSGDGFGGGLDWEGSGTGTLLIDNCVITDNKTTDGDGGGLTVTNTGGGTGSVTITNSTISNNTPARAAAASPIGGGIFVGTTTAIFLTNCTISGNSVAGSAGQGQGGGIFIFGPGGAAGQSSLTNCIISNNTSPSDGGGIYSTTPLTINATTFSGNNSGRFGGGLFINHSNATTTISKNTFINNNATTRGGGIYLGTSTTSNILNVSYSRFAGNTSAAQNGVAIADGAATLQNNWWGCNLGPSNAACNQAAVFGTGSINFTPWLVFNQTASPASICIGATSTLTASFLLNSSGGAVAASNLDVLIGLPITFNSPVNGTLSAAQTTIQAAGTATVTFTATGAGAGSANAVFVPLVENFTVTTSPTITVNPTPTTPGITAGGPTTFCSPGSVTLTSSSATGNQWYLNGNPIGGATNPTFVATASGNYTVVVTALGCPSAPSAGTSITASCGLSINDVTQIEGNAGTTTFQFTVSLSAPAPAGSVTFDITTADNTATDANNDYEINTLIGQSIPAGSSSTTFNVTVNGDATVEPDETFFVNITNVVGATVTDGQGQGTITNDDCAPGSQIFNYTGGVQDFVVPTGITFLTVAATGADGGDNPPSAFGGSGGVINATFPVLPGDNIRVIVGEAGKNTFYGSGGGGTGVINCGNPANCATGTLLVVAGGGGGGAFGSNLGGGASSIAGSGSGGNSIGGVGGGGGVNSPGSEGGGQASKTSISAGGIGISIGGKGFGGGGGTQIPPGGGGGGGGYTGGNGTAISGSGGSNFVDVTAVSGFTNNGGITGGSGGNNTNGVVTLSYSCNVCPTIPNLSSTSSPVCQNSNITLNATGLTGMSSTYGIEFKYFAAPTADPYTGGTTIATITNGSLSGGGTTASTTTSFATAGTYYIYAILSPVPGDAGCRPSATTTVVVDLAATLNAGPDQTICSSTTQVQLAAVLGGAATNGVWDINPPFGSFSPTDTDPNALYTPTLAERTAGSVVMTYQTNDPAGVCPQAVDQMTIFIQPAATVNAGSDYSVCQSATVFPALNGTIGGAATSGTWSGGTGIFSPDVNTLNATYTPSPAELAAAPTTIILTLTTNDPAGICGAVSDQVQISIDLAATLNAGPDQTICSSTTQVQLAAIMGGAATNGVWSINPPNGSFSPTDTDPNALYTPTLAERTAGSVVMTYQTNDPAGVCPQAVDQMTIFIQPAATANAGSDIFICQSASVFPQLNGTIGGVATTGTWSGGTGTFSPNVNTLNATYTPSPAELAAAPATVTLTLITNDPAGVCGAASDQVQIFIGQAATLNAGPDQTICTTTAQVQLAAVLGGAATNGVWSINPPNGSFSPSDTDPNALYTPTAGERTAGIVVMTYQTNDPAGACPQAIDQMTIFISPLPNLFTVTGGGVYCNGGNPNAVGLSGSQTGVNYQLFAGTSPVGGLVSGTGSALNFGPQGTVGTYTVVASNAGCTRTMTGSVNVSTMICAPSITDPCTCLNNATTLSNGQFSETIQVNAPAGQTWTVTAVIGLYTMASPAPPAAPIPVTVGTVMTESPAGVYTLAGKHIDAVGYTISVSNGLGTTLSIGNTCAYPNPSITGLPATICPNSTPITLTGNPGDANIVSQSFTVDGVPATTFTPSVPGNHTIVYTVNGGAPKASGPLDPGCIQSVSQTVLVHPIVAGTITGPANASICAGQSSSVNINLGGAPNFTGVFNIAVSNGIGTPTPNFNFIATVNGPSAVAIPAANLTNTSTSTTIYTITWVSLADANGCPVASLTGSSTIVVYPTPTVAVTGGSATDVCPGNAIVYNVTNPNLIPGSAFNWTAIGANAVVLGGANNVAFGNGAVNTTLGLSCPVNPAINPITFTFTPVGPAPLGCQGTPVTAQVNVRDVVAPTWVTSSTALNGTFNCQDATGIAAANALFPVATDICDNDVTNINLISNNFAQSCGVGYAGIRTKIWTVTDACGNTSAQFVQTITIVDNAAPTWTTTAGSLNRTVDCGDVAALAAANALIPAATDNCDVTLAPVKVNGIFAVGACPNAGFYTNTFTVTDDCGNTSTTFTQVITVTDLSSPILNSPAAQTLDVGAGAGCAVPLPDYRGLITPIDCGPVTLTQSPAIGTTVLGAGGSQTVTITATDGCGNSSTRNITVNLVDATAPVARCHNITVNLSAAGAASIVPSQIDGNGAGPTFNPKSSDNCGLATFNAGLTFQGPNIAPNTNILRNYNCTNLGANPITLIVTDASGNQSTCNATVTVVDVTVPAITCPANQVVAKSATCTSILPDFRALVVATDACGPVSIAQSPAAGTIIAADVANLAIIMTASDGSGNSSTCTFSVQFVDQTAPVISGCPSNISVTTGVGNTDCQIAVNWTAPTASDNCSPILGTITLTSTHAPGQQFFVGTTTVTYTATDPAGNSSTCSFTVTVTDNTIPTIYCITPGNKVVNAVSAGCTYTHSGGNNWDAAGSDNCIPLLAATYTLSGATTGTGNSLDGKVFNYGVTTVTWRVVDQFTNSTTCSFTVTVSDTQVPTITCPATVNVNTNVAGCSASVPAALTTLAAASDNCGIVLTEWSVSGASPISSGLGNLGTHIFNIGTSLVTYRVSDAAGNSTICSFNVVVTNAVAGAISGTSTVAQNAMTTSTVTFTGSGGLAPYTFTYNINGGGTQTVSTSGSSNITTVAQSNAVLGTFTYTLLSVTDANGCPGAVNLPNTAVITVATGTPDLTSSQLFTTTQITAGGVIDEVVAVRNVGAVATSAPISFNVTTYAPITGLTVSSNTNATVTIGFTTYTLDNLNWNFNSGTGIFTSNAGIFINPGQTKYIGVRITRGSSPGQGANGSVNHTLTITNGTGGGETPASNNSISNTLLKN